MSINERSILKNNAFVFSIYSILFFTCTLLAIPMKSYANDGPEPPDHITSITFAKTVASHYFDNTQYTPIGACTWQSHTTLLPYITPELDEYLPDLVVSVYNGEGNNPWEEARVFDAGFHLTGSEIIKKTTGYDLTNGNNGSIAGVNHYDSIRTRSVDVIGNPFTLLHFPFLNLKVDTIPYLVYYNSDLDALQDRSGSAETCRPESHSPIGYTIGQSELSHWGYEFPRSMTVNVDNNFKASVIAALHAVDIVTNNNTLHTVVSTSDSCGKSCSVSNVIEELKDKHEIWEEVYPVDRHIKLGESDSIRSLGSEDDVKGNGNYVFVVWRHYRGCVQGKKGDHFLKATTQIKKTIKR